MKKILITGKDGQVGWELQRTLAPYGKIFAYDRHSLDLLDPKAIIQTIRDIQPDIIVNAAAYTAVDKAEIEEKMAHAINAVAPGVIAEEAKRCGALFVHYSTDYVFDGRSQSPYQENDQTCPLNKYGKTKLEGELAIQQVFGKYLILRTSWVYGMRGKNFLLTMLRLAKEKEFLNIVGDQVGAPTWSRLIAGGTAHMVSQFCSFSGEDRSGIYHLTAGGQTSWFEFAKEIFNHLKNSSEFPIPKLQQIKTVEYPLPALRPLHTVLSNEKMFHRFKISLPDWKESLFLCMGK